MATLSSLMSDSRASNQPGRPPSRAQRIRWGLSLLTLAGLAGWIASGSFWIIPFDGYYFLLTLQLLCALVLAGMVALYISVGASILRIVTHRSGEANGRSPWQWFTLEGVVAGTVLAVIWLTHATRDTYVSPSGREQLEFRLPSLLEGPLGLHPCSDVFVPVIVTYTDAQGRKVVRRGAEGTQPSPALRVLSREILWSADTPARATVILSDTGMELSFPDEEPHQSGEGLDLSDSTMKPLMDQEVR